MFVCLLKIQLAGAGVGTFPSFVSLITDAALKQINWETSVKASVEHGARIVSRYKQAALELKENTKYLQTAEKHIYKGH